MLQRLTHLLALGDGFKNQSQAGNVVLDCGNTVPADATSGYAIGALFIHLDGGDGSALYVNEGTAASCDFNLITVAAA